jgi:hypothetical protein
VVFGLFKKRPQDPEQPERPAHPAPALRRSDAPRPAPTQPTLRLDPLGAAPAGATIRAAPVQPPTAEERPLGEILAPIVAEHERELASEKSLRQLESISAGLERLLPHLRAAPSAWRHLGAQDVIQAIVDAVADLTTPINDLWPTPPIDVHPPGFDEAGLGEVIEASADGEAVADTTKLEVELEGVLFELRAMREMLIDGGVLAELGAEANERVRAAVGSEMARLCSRLATLVQQAIEVLSYMPADEAGTEDGGPAPAVEAPAGTAATPTLPWPEVPAPPAEPAAAPEEAERTAPSAAPWPVGILGAAEPEAAAAPALPGAPPPPATQETGLALAPVEGSAGEPIVVQAPEPQPPDYEHRSEEEALRYLQSFFNENSPEGALLKSSEEEFVRMVRRLLTIVFPDVDLSESEMARRLRQLKDTFALRKKLRNTLTLPEFKAYFAKRK